MSDQTLNRANAQGVLFAEFHQLRQPRHRAVVMQNLAKHSGRLQPSHARKIDSRLCVTSPAQYAAILRPQGKDMTGLHEIFGRGFWIGNRQDRRRAIVCADSGSDTARRVH